MQSNKGSLDQLSGLNEWNAPSVTSQHLFFSLSLNLNWQVGIFTRPPWRTSWQVMLWFTEVSERAAPSCAPSSTTPSGYEVRMFSAGGRMNRSTICVEPVRRTVESSVCTVGWDQCCFLANTHFWPITNQKQAEMRSIGPEMIVMMEVIFIPVYSV